MMSSLALLKNNTKIPNAKEERAALPNGMEKYNWH